MSDTHGYHNHIPEIPDGDILIHCGDFTMMGDIQNVEDFAKWISKLEFTDRIVIAGNHERCLSDQRDLGGKIFSGKAVYLQDQSIEIDGIKFYGTPWTSAFPNMRTGLGFYRAADKLDSIFKWIPEDTDVLLSHGPPHGILDLPNNAQGHHCGDMELFSRLMSVKPKVHAFGHIHESHGIQNGWNNTLETIFINCSLIDYTYNLVHRPITIDLR